MLSHFSLQFISYCSSKIQKQQNQLAKLRRQLTKAEELWRDANENEMPEEKYRVMAENKRNELHNLELSFFQQKDGEHRNIFVKERI